MNVEVYVYVKENGEDRLSFSTTNKSLLVALGEVAAKFDETFGDTCTLMENEIFVADLADMLNEWSSLVNMHNPDSVNSIDMPCRLYLMDYLDCDEDTNAYMMVTLKK